MHRIATIIRNSDPIQTAIGWVLFVAFMAGVITAAAFSQNAIRFLTDVAILAIIVATVWLTAWGLVSGYEARTPFDQEYPDAGPEREALRPASCQLHNGVRECCTLRRDTGDGYSLVDDLEHTAIMDRADKVLPHE
jgi:hypothetical protein